MPLTHRRTQALRVPMPEERSLVANRIAHCDVLPAPTLAEEPKHNLRRRAWQFLEDSQSSRCAMVYNHFSMLAILACVCISMANLLHPAFASQAILGLEVGPRSRVVLARRRRWR